MRDFLFNYVFTKSFLLGVSFCIGLFSNYIFGDDNLLEQLIEWWIHFISGIEVDLDIDNIIYDHKPSTH